MPCYVAHLICWYAHVLLMQMVANVSCSVDQCFIGITLPCPYLFFSCSNLRFGHAKVWCNLGHYLAPKVALLWPFQFNRRMVHHGHCVKCSCWLQDTRPTPLAFQSKQLTLLVVHSLGQWCWIFHCMVLFTTASPNLHSNIPLSKWPMPAGYGCYSLNLTFTDAFLYFLLTCFS